MASFSSVLSRMPSSVVIEVALGVEHRQDLALEAALARASAAQLLRAQAEGVHLLAGDAPLVGDQLGGDALRHDPAVAA